MSDLAEFLLQRIAEDEAVAIAMRDDIETWGNPYSSGASVDFEDRFDPARVLAECEAKRRIVERCAAVDYAMPCTPLAHGILSLLAAPYVDHPDYREEWRP